MSTTQRTVARSARTRAVPTRAVPNGSFGRGASPGPSPAEGAPGQGAGPGAGRRRGHAATAALSAVVVAAIAAVTLSGCGIRSTAVPVDAGIPASRTACPPTPGATGAPSADSTGPAVLTTQAPTYVLPGVPSDLPSQLSSETPWEALASALPVGPGQLSSGAASGSGSGSGPASTTRPSAVSGSERATPHQSAAPRAASPASSSASAASPASPAGNASSVPSSSGFSVNDCPGVSANGTP